MIRLLFLLTFAIFWGGLTFYTGIVVRISHGVVSDSMEGGLITQRVTEVLQYLGVATVVLMTINGFAVLKHHRLFGRILLVFASVTAAAIIGLFVVHGRLDAVIDIAEQLVTDDERFAEYHRQYNQLTTIEWLSTMSYLILTSLAWRSVDRIEGR